MYKRKINWRRGILKTSFMISILVLFFLGIAFVTNTANASKPEQFIQVNVQAGDSLWAIADRYDNNQIDLRKFIYQIKEINKIDDTIYPGQVLYIPVQ